MRKETAPGGSWEEAYSAMSRDVISYNATMSACEKGHWTSAMSLGPVQNSFPKKKNEVLRECRPIKFQK